MRYFRILYRTDAVKFLAFELKIRTWFRFDSLQLLEHGDIDFECRNVDSIWSQLVVW